MKRFFLCTMMLVAFICASAQTNQLFDEGWQFTHNGKTISVDLPHDWDIFTAPDPEKGPTGTGGGWYAAGKGEYRKSFKTPIGELVKLHFEGVYQKAEVFVNGQKAGQHGYGYTPFTIDVTPFLYRDKRMNEVVVKVNNSEQPNCRWYSGSGIYRHVWLQTMPALHIAENGVFVTTPEVKGDKATVRVEVTVENESNQDRNTTVAVGNEQLIVSVPAKQTKAVTTTFIVNNPHLWSPNDPYRYEVKAELKEAGKTIDHQTVHYGIRSFSFDTENGFVLNGKRVLLNGACVHHDDGLVGAMAFDDAEIRKVRLMKEAGFNLIRTSHNPTTRAFLDACDSIGMLVIGEAFDGWRTQKNPYDYSTLIDSCYREDIHAMVLRDRNHPSIISWSIGNEVIERKELRVVQTARQLKAAILECDKTRPVTEALCAWDRDWEIYDPHFEVLDVAGYNYMIFKHKSDHDRPGESFAPGGQPDWHGTYCGDVDVTGWRKPISHYRDILWNDHNDLYMAVKEPDGYHGKIHETMWSVWPTWPSWTWPGWEGKSVEVEVYTKAPEVKLYLNDKLIDTKKVSRETQYKAVFSLPYEAGTLRAEAGGKSVSLATAGKPARLQLTTDKKVITANGQSLAYITVEVVDKEGRLCPEAAIPCEAVVKGQGQLMAFASADMKDREPYTSPKVTTWKGRAMLVVRSGKAAGKTQVTIKSSLPAATLTIQSKK